MADAPVSAPDGSAAYDADNLLDRHSRRCTLELNYRHMMERERAVADRELGLRGGDVLSVGCGWHPGRHLFPAPAFRLVGADADPAKVSGVLETGRADDGVVGYAGRLGLAPRSFDVVLYRLVLHHLVFQGPLRPCFEEAARLLRPGGALIAVEPGLWHPVGAATGAGQPDRPGHPGARDARRHPAVASPPGRRSAGRGPPAAPARRHLHVATAAPAAAARVVAAGRAGLARPGGELRPYVDADRAGARLGERCHGA